MIDERPGRVVVRVRGRGAAAAFADEQGGHRWQRVPPNERRGRVHSSTITVAVLDEVPLGDAGSIEISDGDLEWSTCRASGSGGQHLQKTDSAVQVLHRPTGLIVRSEQERSQHRNRATALAELRARLAALEQARASAARARERRGQIGSGMRGDKRRTIRCQDGAVVDHVTGRTWRLREYLRGEW